MCYFILSIETGRCDGQLPISNKTDLPKDENSLFKDAVLLRDFIIHPEIFACQHTEYFSAISHSYSCEVFHSYLESKLDFFEL